MIGRGVRALLIFAAVACLVACEARFRDVSDRQDHRARIGLDCELTTFGSDHEDSDGAMNSERFTPLPDMIRANAAARPESIALIQDERRLNYGALDKIMDRLAAALQREGAAHDQQPACDKAGLLCGGRFFGASGAALGVVTGRESVQLAQLLICQEG